MVPLSVLSIYGSLRSRGTLILRVPQSHRRIHTSIEPLHAFGVRRGLHLLQSPIGQRQKRPHHDLECVLRVDGAC